MYICVCQGVTESQIADSIRCGATSLPDLREKLGVTSCCGKCKQEVNYCLKKHACTGNGCCLGCSAGACAL